MLLAHIIDYLAGRTNRLDMVTYLHKRGIRHPHQFLNNLIHFGGTGQSLAVYDQNSEFVPRNVHHIPPYRADSDEVMVLNSNANDVQVVGISNTARSHAAPVDQPRGPDDAQRDQTVRQIQS